MQYQIENKTYFHISQKVWNSQRLSLWVSRFVLSFKPNGSPLQEAGFYFSQLIILLVAFPIDLIVLVLRYAGEYFAIVLSWLFKEGTLLLFDLIKIAVKALFDALSQMFGRIGFWALFIALIFVVYVIYSENLWQHLKEIVFNLLSSIL